jgi:hypothetical protein
MRQDCRAFQKQFASTPKIGNMLLGDSGDDEDEDEEDEEEEEEEEPVWTAQVRSGRGRETP